MSLKHQQKKYEQAVAQREQQVAEHKAFCEGVRKTLQCGRLVLVGVKSQGGSISECFITDIKGDDMLGCVAVRCCSENDPKGGMYFDIRDLVIYHIYSEAETATLVEEDKAANRVPTPTVAQG